MERAVVTGDGAPRGGPVGKDEAARPFSFKWRPPEDVYEALRRISSESGLSINHLVSAAVDHWLEENKAMILHCDICGEAFDASRRTKMTFERLTKDGSRVSVRYLCPTHADEHAAFWYGVTAVTS